MISSLIGYDSALNKAAFFVHLDAGYLSVSKPDQSQFLQRQTSNDIRQLDAERVQLNVITSPTARILDVFYAFKECETTPNFPDQSPAIGMFTLPGRTSSTFQFLKSRIFFMDQVVVINRSEEFSQIELFGPLAGQTLTALGFSQPPQNQQIICSANLEFPLWALCHEPAFGLRYRLIIPVPSLGSLVDTLRNLEVEQASEGTYQTLRIETGLPDAEHELTDRYTPLECGLRGAISETKGCYTGQEVIARQINYDKVSHRLCGLKLLTPCLEGTQLSVDDRPIGVVTSFIHSPRFNNIGLAMIRRPYDKIGETIQAGAQIAQICAIPFQ